MNEHPKLGHRERVQAAREAKYDSRDNGAGASSTYASRERTYVL